MTLIQIPSTDYQQLLKGLENAVQALENCKTEIESNSVRCISATEAAALLGWTVDRLLKSGIPYFNESIQNGEDTRKGPGRKDYSIKVSALTKWIEQHSKTATKAKAIEKLGRIKPIAKKKKNLLT